MKRKSKLSEYKRILERNELLFTMAEQGYKTCDTKQIAEQTTCYIFAPMVYCFTGWVLKRAQELGIRRLYFLSRDGWQFYHCAKELSREWNLSMECRYLECSRYAMRIPCFGKMGDAALDFICLGGVKVTFLSMMRRAGLNSEEAEEIAKAIGYHEEITAPLSYRKVLSFRESLKNCVLFQKRLKEISREAYPMAEGYLRQEGLFDDIEYAIVDSGWTGTTQQTLQQLLNLGGYRKRIRGFYWGLYEIPKGTEAGDYYTYYFSPKGDYHKKVFFSNCLFEAVFSAPYGMVLSYCQRGESYIPIYERIQGSQAEEMECQKNLIMNCVRQRKEKVCPEKSEEFLGYRQILYLLLKSFMGYPNKEEAEWYGNYQFSDDVLEESQQSIAAKLTEEELKKHHVFHKMKYMFTKNTEALPESAWYEASAVLYGNNTWWHRKQYQWYKYLIYIRKKIKSKDSIKQR